jgi:outer membrane receptor protein involved in Fe transport
VFLADTLSINGSYRFSDYSDPIDDSTNTYGAGIEWAPIEDVKFRGSYQRAVRAPNIVELFQASGLALYDNDEDPCAGAVPTRSLADCQRTGVTPEQYGTILDNVAGQYNYIAGGNLDLIPESSDSWTAGVVFVPSFVDNMSFTVDYFSIKVEDVISILQPTETLENCLDTGSPETCDLIHRDSEGTLWLLSDAFIVGTNINLASWETSGVDVTFDWTLGIGDMGSLGFNVIGTWLEKFDVDSGISTYDCAGLYGTACGTPLPEWRHKARVTWNMPWNADVSLTWRFMDGVTFTSASDQEALQGNFNEVDKELEAQNYLDIAGSYTMFENYTLRLGINNVLDEEPPISAQVGAGFGNGNTFPQVYDAFGRYVFMGLTAKF